MVWGIYCMCDIRPLLYVWYQLITVRVISDLHCMWYQIFTVCDIRPLLYVISDLYCMCDIRSSLYVILDLYCTCDIRSLLYVWYQIFTVCLILGLKLYKFCFTQWVFNAASQINDTNLDPLLFLIDFYFLSNNHEVLVA